MDVKPRLRSSRGHLYRRRQIRPKLALVLCVAAWAWLTPSRAIAQVISDYYPAAVPGLADLQSIPSRPRPAFDPQGIRFGDFTAHPFIATGAGYDSNYLGSTPQSGSPIFGTAGGVDIASDWSRDKLAASANVANSTYLSAPSQRQTNASAGVGSIFDIGQDSLALAGLYVHDHISATSLDAANVSVPVPFDVGYGRAAYTIRLSGISIEPELSYASIRYSNLAAGGQTTNLSYFNRDIALAGVVTRYALSNLTSAVATIRAFNTNYLTAQPGLASDSSNAYQVLGGLTRIGEAIWQYQVLGGLESRQFNNAAYKSVTTPIVSASVIWSPTRLTSFTGLLRRDIEDTVYSNQIGYKFTGLTLQVDHELLQNVLLRGSANGQLANYLQSSQQDLLLVATSGVTWLLNRNVSLNGSYSFSTRSSNVTSHYDRNLLLLQVRFRL